MKKIILIVLAVCLAMPAISFAGTATSRWDLTIGGTVKFTAGWSDYGVGDLSSGGTAPRADRAGYRTARNGYGNQIWGGGETGLSFFVMGPDTFGAKTSAFMSTDFVGLWGGGSTNYGSLDLVVATINFNWPQTELKMGMAGGFWGMMGTFPGMGFSNLGFGGKGAAPVNPGITVAQKLNKDWTLKFAITSPRDDNSNANSIAGPTDNSYLHATTPLFAGGIQYSSGACGKVGPWQLTFKTDGFWVKEKKIYSAAGGSGTSDMTDKDLNGFYWDIVALVPIIPEKNGNKAGALYVDGTFYTSQDLGGTGYLGGWGTTNSYTRSTGEYAAPHQSGYMFHTQYYFTDSFSTNLYYYAAENFTSNVFKNKAANADTLLRTYSYMAQLQYQASPAVKFQLLWDQSHSRYMGQSSNAALKQTGTTNTWKFSAFYYF
jgi:hypothetical protein